MNFRKKFANKASELTPAELVKLIQIAYDLKRAAEIGDQEKLKLMESMKPVLLIILEYLIMNMNNPAVDIELIPLLARFLGIKLSEDKEEELETEEEKRLSKEEKERRHRLMMYEIYKILNPRQLAGETALDNFINNVKTKGIRTAMLYEGAEYAKFFVKEDIEVLESHGMEIKGALSKAGISMDGLGR